MRLVTAAVIIEEGKLLLARRAEGSSIAGRWELPGGKMEEGESLSECLRRELMEELCIDTEVGDEIGRNPVPGASEPMVLVAMKARIMEGNPKPVVHSEVRWVDAGHLSGYDFPPADVPLIEAVKKLMDEGMIAT